MSEEKDMIISWFMGICTIGLGICIVIILHLKTEIKTGKQFILNTATYKCIKTNELKESK